MDSLGSQHRLSPGYKTLELLRLISMTSPGTFEISSWSRRYLDRHATKSPTWMFSAFTELYDVGPEQPSGCMAFRSICAFSPQVAQLGSRRTFSVRNVIARASYA